MEGFVFCQRPSARQPFHILTRDQKMTRAHHNSLHTYWSQSWRTSRKGRGKGGCRGRHRQLLCQSRIDVMPGRHVSAGRARTGVRRLSTSQIQWRQASATELVETGGLVLSGGNGYIDPHKAIGKLKYHGRGLWGMQALVAFVMSVIAVLADTRYGLTYWYTNISGGGKLRDMQYAWAFFNTICASCGIWVYLLWNEAVAGVHRDQRVFRQKVHIWLSYFTWAFGIWTTAVVLVSFKNYSFSGNYPTDLTCAFLGAVVCCVLSDTWALGKLCSLGTYAARLEEEWRLAPHQATAPLEPDPLLDLEEVGHRTEYDASIRSEERDRRLNREKTSDRRPSRGGRRASGPGVGHLARGKNTDGQDSSMTSRPAITAAAGLAVSEDDVLLPHAFERLWSSLGTQGEFQTHIKEAVAQTAMVRHLNDRGFQVVAAGEVDGLTRVLFCAKEATHNGTGAWFLAELLQNEAALTLEATFKSKSADVVPGFVKAFMLQNIFTMDDAAV